MLIHWHSTPVMVQVPKLSLVPPCARLLGAFKRLCNTEVADILPSSSTCGEFYQRRVRRRLSNTPKKHLALWFTTFVLALYLLFADGETQPGPLQKFAQAPKNIKVPAQRSKPGDPWMEVLLVTASGAEQERRVVYRDPPNRPVPPQPDLSGRYPQDGKLIGWSGLVRDADKPDERRLNASSGTVPPPDALKQQSINQRIEGTAEEVAREGQSVKKDEKQIGSRDRAQTGSWWSPWGLMKRLVGKPKRIEKVAYKPYVPPTFPSVWMDGPTERRLMPVGWNKPGHGRTLPKEVRPEGCSRCFQFNYRHHINPLALCDEENGQQQPELLFIILSQAESAEARQSIRATWGRYSRSNSASVRYVFVVGANLESEVQETLATESRVYGDILQEDFAETRYSDTNKLLGSLRWARHYCKVARFLIRTDDRTYINVPSLAAMIQKREDILRNVVTGSCSLSTKVIRDQRHKWYVSYEEYPEAFFPSYCSASTFVIPADVSQTLLDTAPDVPHFLFDDVYVGMVMKKAHVSLYNQASHFNTPMAPGLGCPEGSPWYAVQDASTKDMRKLWEYCQQNKA